ncbi:hypothetical protein [Macrococcoides caseolyticum]|uniref:hypothetical protein n=1 Tax=Macrococcoides caseolyticum TaxID=69966 RepID=UPI001F1F5223|nr:hypothetical protein [Macrococcus caseolyticus]MCE4958003.1 hypothetical protein [Macrococcus caseolyticus]
MTPFINTIFDILIEGQENIIEQMIENLALIKCFEVGVSRLQLTNQENMILYYLIQDKVFGSKYSKLTLIELTQISGLSRNKVDQIINKHSDNLTEVKSKPKIYEINDVFLNKLREMSNEY